MKITFLLKLLLLFLVLSSNSLASDWIGLNSDPATLLGFEWAQDEQSNHSQLLFINHPFDDIDLTLEYARESISEFNEDFNSHRYFSQLGFLLNDSTYLALSYQFQGNKNELEDQQYQIMFEYNPYPAYFMLGLITGDIDIYTSNSIRATLNIPQKVSSDMQSYSIGIGWWFEQFSMFAKHQYYDYQRDLSVLSRRPIFQLLIKPAALAQSGLLVTQQSSLGISYPMTTRTLSLQVLSSVSALDAARNQSLALDWSEQINRSMDVTLALIHSDDSSNAWSISAGLIWQV